jgi:DNA-binding response OmpR family regulator
MRLLVVEDERRLAGALQKGLRAEGFQVDVALDGTLGLAMATENAYDLIVLDIMLPGINGYRVCSALRSAGDETPIIMLTAKDGEYDEAEGLETGADDYLTKPFSYMVLVARIKALLRRSGRAHVERLEVGDLGLLPAEHRCYRGSTEVGLTPREFAILEQLARRAGEVVTKSEIVEEVWDMAYDGDLNVVEVHVSALRRKIDAPFDRQSLETVRGVGYRLVDDGA